MTEQYPQKQSIVKIYLRVDIYLFIYLNGLERTNDLRTMFLQKLDWRGLQGNYIVNI